MKSHLLTAIIVSFILFFPPRILAQANMQDSLALVNLYNNTHGSNWTNHTNWLTAAPVNTWYGVSLVNNRVESLNLQNNKLTGDIPSALKNLSALKYLLLGFNQFNDTIPDFIGSLKNLISLNLSSNHLSGTIPASFGNLSNLQVLDLDYNLQLSGTIPDSLKYLSNLIDLDLSGNSLTGGIPDFIGNFNNIESISLHGNLLGGSIPFSIGNLSHLKWLLLSEDQLTGSIPSSFGNLQNLESLALDHNYLSDTIPFLIGNLLMLRELLLYSNQFSGKIPSSFGNLSGLHQLSLHDNLLSDSIPSTLLNLDNLQSLSIQNNQFTFSGMEGIVQHFSNLSNPLIYAPQANILIHQNNNILSVSVGGSLENETFDWYKDGSNIITIAGDSSFTVTSMGQYSVVAHNSIATQLTLYSNTINVTTLPLTWISVSATNAGKYVLLSWKTAHELNNNYFSIECSLNGIDFSEVGQVKSKGNSSQLQQYSFEDFNFLNKQKFYRIKQVDNDGKFSYSNIVNVDFLTSTTIELFPNPAKNILAIKGLGLNNSILFLINEKGNTVSRTQTSNDIFNWNIQNLSAGNYFLIISQDNKIIASLKFIKQ
jgi:Leucine-rich repeat (LRR) protein